MHLWTQLKIHAHCIQNTINPLTYFYIKNAITKNHYRNIEGVLKTK